MKITPTPPSPVVLLWWLSDAPALSKKAHIAIANKKNLVLVSAVVVWEIRIKVALGKLELPRNFKAMAKNQPFETLDITFDQAHAVGDLPAHYRDPFDRMLVA